MESTLRIFQKGFNYDQDGPGNRLVIHMQGCNMRCPWCANPEGLEESGGHSISVSDLVSEVVSCKSLFIDNGGVTFTGGEATLQLQELEEVLTLLKGENIHTALETNGTHPELAKLFSLLDLMIIDCKHVDDMIHSERTGMTNQEIIKNIQKAASIHSNVWVRIPLVKGFNTSADDLQGFLRFAKEIMELSGERQVLFEFLPYHEYGKSKWKADNKVYQVEDGFVSTETLTMFKKAFEDNRIPIHQT
jgi:pyruvate formate lyase activating enzyme